LAGVQDWTARFGPTHYPVVHDREAARTDELQLMPLERAPTGASIIDVLDHVLDKGIVIDAWEQVALMGMNLLTVEARVVVASIDTYVQNAQPETPRGSLEV
jgi:hypothetical protein